jgi:hypothetical protein
MTTQKRANSKKKRQPDHEDLIAQNTHIIIEKVSYISCPARLKEMR